MTRMRMTLIVATTVIGLVSAVFAQQTPPISSPGPDFATTDTGHNAAVARDASNRQRATDIATAIATDMS